MYLRLVTEKPVSLENEISETQKIQIYTITMIDALGNVMSNGLVPSVEYWRAKEPAHFKQLVKRTFPGSFLYNFGKEVRLFPKLYLLPVKTADRFFVKKTRRYRKKYYFCIRKLEKVYQIYTKPNFVM